MVTVVIDIGSVFLLVCVLALALLAACVRALVRSAQVARLTGTLEAMLVRVVAKASVDLMTVPEVHDSFTNLIAGGINAWLDDPDAQRHIETLVSRTPHDGAKELGRSLPELLASFARGLVDNVRPGTAQTVENSLRRAAALDSPATSPRAGSPG